MALTALCSDDDWGRSWAEIMQYRFTSAGVLDGHAIGNLLLTALWDRDTDPVKGLDRVGALLKVVGRVLPMALEPLDIEATEDLPTDVVPPTVPNEVANKFVPSVGVINIPSLKCEPDKYDTISVGGSPSANDEP